MSRAVEDILVGLLPTADESALLEACLHSGARAHQAWARWGGGRAGTPAAVCRALSATRTLMPLLERSVTRNGLDVPPEVRAYVRVAALREELRADRVRRLAAQALALLDEAGAAVFVVRGAALAATAYPSWSLRHCHDVDLLVEPERLAATADALERTGFAAPVPARRRQDGLTVRHASGLRIALHTRPFAAPHYDVSAAAFAGAGTDVAFAGTRARMPAPAATLVHVLGHATYSPNRRNLRWVADAWHLVAHHDDLDWRNVERRLDAYRLALPVAALLEYLAALGVAIPAEVVAGVRARAAAADVSDEDAALGGALAAAGHVRDLWRAASWSGRLRLGRWAVAPSPAYVRGEFRLQSNMPLPLCYAYRPLRFAAATLAAWRARTPRSSRPASP